jgi:hypothetical protein
VDVLQGLTSELAHQTVVVALVVPRGAAVVLCADNQTLDEPKLNLRTGRVEPGAERVPSCEPPVPSPSLK